MRECIENEWLPFCLNIGISYELFWTLNPRKIRPFVLADRKKQEEDFNMRNFNAWLNGIYVAQAIGSCFSKQDKYPEQPIDFKESKKDSKKDATIFEAWAIAFNRDFEKKQLESQ